MSTDTPTTVSSLPIGSIFVHNHHRADVFETMAGRWTILIDGEFPWGTSTAAEMARKLYSDRTPAEDIAKAYLTQTWS